MSAGTFEGAVLELLWSVWTELGVPGVERKFQGVALDPEPLIVFTPAFSSNDPRLLEQVTAWCERHGDGISKTRLDGLLRRVPEDVGSSFVAFAQPLQDAAASWRSTADKVGRSGRVVRSVRPPLGRPALARLRMRSLSGTGARADVLCELLGSPSRWTSATDLEHLGYTRRYIAGVLADLTAALLTIERPGKGAASFRLRDPRALATLIDAESLIWGDWISFLTLAWQLVELEESAARSMALVPIKMHDAGDELLRLSLAIGTGELPPPTGKSAWPRLVRWGLNVLHHWPRRFLGSTRPPS